MLILWGALTVAGCNLGPIYHRPKVPAPASWKDAAAAPATAPPADWWTAFQSTTLDGYMVESQKANDDIAAAIARVREADAQVRIAGAPLLPSLQAGVEGVHEREPVSGGGLATYSEFLPLLSASYEIDFWGKNRAALRAARATADASRYDRVTVALSVMTSVANTYFQALAFRDRLQIAQDNRDAGQQTLDGLKLELQAGTANALDVAQQATVVANLNAAVPPLAQQLRQSEDALAIVLGRTPESLNLADASLTGLAVPAVAAGLPSEILARRPDVAEAEANLIAANANVAQARAAFFPSFDLTADGGYATTHLSDLLSPANAVFSLAAALTQPIFEGGALKGQSEYARARYVELLANYHKAVISALGNVEDALVAVRLTAEQEAREQEAVEAARQAYDLAQAELRAGTINILTLLNTETALFTAQDSFVQIRLSHLQSLVNLYGALGGGWQSASEK